MPVSAIVTTPGSATANSYVTIAVADQYHLDRPPAGTTWDDATVDQKTAAILFATKLLDSMYVWSGWAAISTQVLGWPRTGMWYRTGYYVPSDLIPVELQFATAEYARQLLVADRSADSDIETQGISSLSAGPVSLSFQATVVAKVIPDAVVNLIPSDWGVVRSRSGVAFRNVVRA